MSHIVSFVLVLSSASALAAAPAFIPVQGFLTDASGTALEGQHDVTLTLYDADVGATTLFSETQTVLVEGGLVTIYLGSETTLDLATFKNNGVVYLGIAVDSDPEMTPRFALGTAPFAAYAEHAGDATTLEGHAAADFRLGADSVDWTDLANVPTGVDDGDNDTLANLTCSTGDVAEWNGTSWACTAKSAQLTEGDVELYVTNDGLDLFAGTTVGGATIATGPHTSSLDWTAITNRPAGLDNGDDDTTYDGTHFATSSQTCGVGNVVVGIDAAGAVICGADADTTYSGTNFATSAQGCGVGNVVTGVDASGAVTCAADTDTTYSTGYGLNQSGTVLSINTSETASRSFGAVPGNGTVSASLGSGLGGSGTSVLINVTNRAAGEEMRSFWCMKVNAAVVDCTDSQTGVTVSHLTFTPDTMVMFVETGYEIRTFIDGSNTWQVNAEVHSTSASSNSIFYHFIGGI